MELLGRTFDPALIVVTSHCFGESQTAQAPEIICLENLSSSEVECRGAK